MSVFKSIANFFLGYRVTLQMSSGAKIKFRCKQFTWRFFNSAGDRGLTSWKATKPSRHVSFEMQNVESVKHRRCIYIRRN